MKTALHKIKSALLILLFFVSVNASSQVVLEWRLVNPIYSSVDPDGAGPARGSVRFTLQIHTVAGTAEEVTGMSTGWSWQSSRAMLPTGPAPIPTCGTSSGNNQPSNITMSPIFAAEGFEFTALNQCSGTVNFVTGSQAFNRRAAGTIDGGEIDITTTWVDVFSATLWTLDVTNPRGGYAALNSGVGGNAGPFGTYAVAGEDDDDGDDEGESYTVNSLSFTTPLALTSPTLPVALSKFEVLCQPNKSTGISWSTSQEINNNYFEVEKSVNGTTWSSLNKVTASGNSSVQKNYEINDAQGGSAFYRLKQVDLDGKVTYSNTVKASCEGRNVFVTLYPIPARDVVNLVVGSDKSIKTALQIFDTKGRMMINMPVSITNGTNNFRVPVQKLAAGEYIIRSSDAGIEINKRFTVIR